MRRFLAISMLFFLGVGLGLPFVQAQITTPACCRRGGTHHCNGNMGGPDKSSGLAGFRSVPESCPYRHHAALASEHSALTITSHRIGIVVLSSEIVQPTESNFYSDHRNDAHKRGPPSV